MRTHTQKRSASETHHAARPCARHGGLAGVVERQRLDSAGERRRSDDGAAPHAARGARERGPRGRLRALHATLHLFAHLRTARGRGAPGGRAVRTAHARKGKRIVAAARFGERKWNAWARAVTGGLVAHSAGNTSGLRAARGATARRAGGGARVAARRRSAGGARHAGAPRGSLRERRCARSARQGAHTRASVSARHATRVLRRRRHAAAALPSPAWRCVSARSLSLSCASRQRHAPQRRACRAAVARQRLHGAEGQGEREEERGGLLRFAELAPCCAGITKVPLRHHQPAAFLPFTFLLCTVCGAPGPFPRSRSSVGGVCLAPHSCTSSVSVPPRRAAGGRLQ
jgi:hypothetical protein